jgi:hypothetical protein
MNSFSLDSLLVFHEDAATSTVKTKSGAAKIPGKRCGGGWTKSTNKCKDESTKSVGSSGKKVRKLTPEGKKTAQELAAKVRKLKGLPVLPSVAAKGSSDKPKGRHLSIVRSESEQLVKAIKGTDEKLAAIKDVPARMKKERLEREKAQPAKAKIKPVAALKAGIKAQKAVAAGDGRAGFEAANEIRTNLGLKPAKMSDRTAATLAKRETKLSAKTKQRIADKKGKAVKAIALIKSKSEKRETGIVDKDSMPDFSKLTPYASGGFGDIYFVGNSVFKVPKKSKDSGFNGSDFEIDIDKEVAIQRAIPDAPKILRYDQKTKIMEMEKVEGSTLWGMPDKSPAEIKSLVSDSIDTLTKIHEAGFAHGDWRGANQILKKDGSLAPMDFGFSKSIKKPDGGIDWEAAASDMVNSFGYDNLSNGFNLDQNRIGWGNFPDAYKAQRSIEKAITESDKKVIYEQYIDGIKMALYKS